LKADDSIVRLVEMSPDKVDLISLFWYYRLLLEHYSTNSLNVIHSFVNKPLWLCSSFVRYYCIFFQLPKLVEDNPMIAVELLFLLIPTKEISA
jgi:hypothetical protein